MNRGRNAAHRFTKPRPIEALAWHGACFDASALEFGHSYGKLHFFLKSIWGEDGLNRILIAKIVKEAKYARFGLEVSGQFAAMKGYASVIGSSRTKAAFGVPAVA